MLFKLAARNVKRQIGNYFIYFVTVSVTISLIFAVNNLIFSDLMANLAAQISDLVQPVLLILCAFIGVVVAFVLSYATSFLLRRRKKEFGLYLTLGMTRRNILTVFAGETAVTFLVSLGVGMLLGLAVYQILMLVFVNFLDIEYAVAGYSLAGVGLTVLMVGVMFVISSLASLGYLRFAKITRLLEGEKRNEKTVKLPFVIVWAVLGIAAIVGIVLTVRGFLVWLDLPDFFDHVEQLLWIVIAFLVSLLVLPVAASKVVVTLFLYLKPLITRGTGIFTVRQLSGRLNASSLMLGVLTVLLSIAVVAPNIFLTQSATAEIYAMHRGPFEIVGSADVRVYEDREETKRDYSFDEDLKLIGEYAEIDESYLFTVYSEAVWTGGSFTDSYVIGESDFSRLCAMLGYSAPALHGGYLQCNADQNWEGSADCFAFVADRNPAASGRIGVLSCPGNMLNTGNFIISDWRVFPDDEAKTYERDMYNVAITLKNSRYNARELRNELRERRGAGFFLREYYRLDELSSTGLFLLGDLFVSAIFVLLTMAMLALKILTMIGEDRERYKVLFRLGASDGALMRSLFAQIFFYYFLPFAVPLAFCFPLVPILHGMVNSYGTILSFSQIALQVAGFAGVILLMYAIYFALTYFIAWRDIKKSVHAIG